MSGLGHERFGAQGGDWGATIATRLAMTGAGPRRRNPSELHTRLLRAGPRAGLPGSLSGRRGVSPGARPLARGGRRLRPHPGHAAPDPRVWAQRFSGGAARLDRREAARLERLRGRRALALLPRRDSGAGHALLGHRDDFLFRAPLRRGGRRAPSASELANACRFPAPSRGSRRKPRCRRASGSSAPTTSRAGPSSRAAATSPRWRSRSSWPGTSGRSSEAGASSTRCSRVGSVAHLGPDR